MSSIQCLPMQTSPSIALQSNTQGVVQWVVNNTYQCKDYLSLHCRVPIALQSTQGVVQWVANPCLSCFLLTAPNCEWLTWLFRSLSTRLPVLRINSIGVLVWECALFELFWKYATLLLCPCFALQLSASKIFFMSFWHFLPLLCLSIGHQWQYIACQSKLQEKLLSKFFNFVWEVCFPEHTWEDLNKQACLSSLSNTNLGHGPKYGGTHTSCLNFSLCKIGMKSKSQDRIDPKIGLFSLFLLVVCTMYM